MAVNAGRFAFVAGGVSMAFPALAAEAEASAMRTRACGATGRGASLALARTGACFASAGFFLRAGLAVSGLRGGGVFRAPLARF